MIEPVYYNYQPAEKLTIKVKGFSGTVTISTWEMQGDTSGAVFSPASDSTILKVDANALLRMLSPFLSFSAHHPEKE